MKDKEYEIVVKERKTGKIVKTFAGGVNRLATDEKRWRLLRDLDHKTYEVQTVEKEGPDGMGRRV